MSTEVLTSPETETSHGDPDEFAHVVFKKDQMKGYVSGEPIRALCGKVWIPTKDYSGLPVCHVCLEEKKHRLAGMGGLN